MDILHEYGKLQAEFSQRQDVQLALVDRPGSSMGEWCAGFYDAADDGTRKIEICKHIYPPVYQILVLLHECRHAIQHKNGDSADEGTDENDADIFMLQQFSLRYKDVFPEKDVADALTTHKLHQIGNAVRRDFSYDPSIIRDFLNP